MRLLSATIVVYFAGVGVTSAASDTTATQNARVICQTFGSYCSQAIRVATCESGLSVWAHNGQYLGLFQMGSWARSTYGHAWNAWAQSQAAYRYFVASGRNWSPWTCKP